MKSDPRTSFAHLVRSRRAVALLGAVAAAFLLLAYGWLRSSEPIDLREARSLEQVGLLRELHDAMDHVRNWPAPLAQDHNIGAIADWVKRPENAQARSKVQLLRKSEHDHAGVLNGLLTQYPEFTSQQLESWRKLDDAALRKKLRQLAEQAVREQKQASLAALLRETRYRQGLEALHVPFPKPDAWWQRAVRMLTWSHQNNSDRWANRFQAAYREQTLPLARLYDALLERKMVILGGASSNDEALRLVRLSQRGSTSAVVFQGATSTTDWALEYRANVPASDERGSDESWESNIPTGIHFYALPWKNASPSLHESPVKQVGGEANATEIAIHPDWPPPPTSSRVKLQEFESFLRRFGVPAGLQIHHVVVSASGSWEKPELALEVGFVHRDLPKFQHLANFCLLRGQVDDLTSQLRESMAKAAKQARTEAAEITEFAGVPVRIGEDSSDPYMWVATFTPPEAPPFQLRGQLNDDLRFVFERLPPLADRLAYQQWLCEREPTLLPVAEKLRLQHLTLEPGEGVVALWELPAEHGQGSSKVRARIPRQGHPSIVLSEPVKERLASSTVKTTRSETHSGKSRLSVAEVQAAAKAELQKRFPKIAPMVELVAQEQAGKVLVRALARISDWPSLELGPVEVVAADQVATVVANLVSFESVETAAAAQWTTPDEKGISHLRLGPAQGKIKEWNPETGTAKLECAVPLAGQTIRWQDALQATGQAWIGDSLESIGEQIAQQLHWEGTSLSLPEYLQGVLVKIEPDPDRDGDHRWLQLNPLRIRAQGHLRLPCLYSARVNARVMIDQDRGVVVNEVGFTRERTIALPWCLLSDPAIRVNLEDRMFTLSALVTPPAPSTGAPVLGGVVRTDNIWLHIAALQGQLGGRFDAQRFRAGVHLQLLHHAKVGTGELDCNFEEQTFTGTMNGSNSLPLLGKVMPLRLSGELRYAGKEQTISLSSYITSKGANQGKLDLIVHFDPQHGATSTTPAQPLEMRGEVRVPYLGSDINVSGASDFEANYHLSARGTVGLWKVALEANREKLTWQYRLAGVNLPWQYSAASFDDVDDEAIRGQLSRLEAQSHDIPAATSKEESDLAVAFRREQPSKPNPGTPRKSKVRPAQYASIAATMRLDQTSQYVVVESVLPSHTAATERFRFPASALPTGYASLDEFKASFWVKRDPQNPEQLLPGVGEIILFAPTSPRVIQLSVQAGEVLKVIDHSDALVLLHRGESLSWPGGQPPSVEVQRQRMLNRNTAVVYASRQIVDNHDPKHLSFRSTPFGVELESPSLLGDDGHRTATLLCAPAGAQGEAAVISVNFDAEKFLPERRDGEYPRFMQIPSARPRIYALAARDNALVYAEAGRDAQGELEVRLGLQGPTSWRDIPIEFIGMPHVIDAQLSDLGEALLSHSAGFAPERVIVGKQGVALFCKDEPERVRLLHAGEATPRLHPLDRDQLIHWPADDSLSLLPTAWNSADKRRDLSWDAVSEAALVPWNSTRRAEPGWGANPLGILIRLADMTHGASP
jgi:hypothetical protein